MESEYKHHPSFGLLSFVRTTSSKGQPLFGSSIKHENVIRLSITQGIVQRKNSTNFYLNRDNLIQVDMSPAQFSEAITNMNRGEGTPVTIKTYGEEIIKHPPEDSTREAFVQELKEQINTLSENMNDLSTFSERIEKGRGTLSVRERQALKEKISSVTRELKENLPFLLEQFNRQMDRSVNEAKIEIASFMTDSQKPITDSKKMLGIK